MKKEYLISTLINIPIWYLILSFVKMELNPSLWDIENRVALIVGAIVSSIIYFIIKELSE